MFLQQHRCICLHSGNNLLLLLTLNLEERKNRYLHHGGIESRMGFNNKNLSFNCGFTTYKLIDLREI